jgi:hypothetical protein
MLRGGDIGLGFCLKPIKLGYGEGGTRAIVKEDPAYPMFVQTLIYDIGHQEVVTSDKSQLIYVNFESNGSLCLFDWPWWSMHAAIFCTLITI